MADVNEIDPCGYLIKGEKYWKFKWHFRPSSTPSNSEPVPVVQVVEAPDIEFEQLAGILSEVDNRHWGAIRQVLIEAKLKAESQLRNDEIIKSSQLTAYYNGWVSYADYCLANLEGLRAGQVDPSGQVRETLDIQR